jgi:hypothetical protein
MPASIIEHFPRTSTGLAAGRPDARDIALFGPGHEDSIYAE